MDRYLGPYTGHTRILSIMDYYSAGGNCSVADPCIIKFKMKIIENTPDRLVIRDVPYLQIFLGLMLAIVGLVITFFFARSVDIHCDRVGSGQVNCRLTEKLLGFEPVGGRNVKKVQKVDVAESRDSDGNAIYRVIFVTDTGNVPLTSYSSSGYNNKARLSQQINAFIQNAVQRSLDVKLAMEWWILIFLFLFTGAGIIMILLAKTTGIELIRSQGMIRILKDGLFGSRQEEHSLHEVEGVDLEWSRGSRGGATYRIAFHLVDGGELLLSRWFSSGRKDKQAAVEAMNKFLEAYHPPQV